MTTLFVGIDVSQNAAQVCFLDQSERILGQFKVANDLPGAEQLVRRILAVAKEQNLVSVVIGLEATGLLGWHLRTYLSQVTDLQPLYPKVYVFNAKVVAGFKKAYPDLPKTDAVDAWVIADRLRFGRLPRPHEEGERFEALQRLTRARYHLVHNLVREKNRFLSTLFLKFSAFVQQEPIKRTFGTTALAVLTEFATAEEVATQSLEQLTQLIVDRSRNRYGDPQEIAAAVQKAARASYRLPKAMADPVNQVLACQINVIRAMEQQIRELDVAIERLLSTVPQTLHSVKGLGPVYIAGIIAEIGSIDRFPNEAALAKYTGLYWSKYQSGNFQAENTRMTRKGNTYLRYYLVEAANSVRMHDAEFRRYYSLKKAESKTHAHKRALVLTARKLIRLVDCLLRSNRLYRPPQGRLHTGGR